MEEQLFMPASLVRREGSVEEPSEGRPEASGKTVMREAPNPNMLSGLTMGSLVAAIMLSLLIAITRGETTPLYITWMAALAMAAAFGVVAAVPRLRSLKRPRSRGSGGA
jgi:hypothetical protein